MILDRGIVYAELMRLRREYREYRDAHWDAERNHIRFEYAEGLYRIFREGIIARMNWDRLNMKEETPPQPRIIETKLNFL